MKTKAPPLDDTQNAVRVARESTTRHDEPLPAGVEQAWADWSRRIAKVDARTMALLRAAFEVGVEAGKSMRS